MPSHMSNYERRRVDDKAIGIETLGETEKKSER